VPAEDEDGSFLHVSVHNSLLCVSAHLVLEGAFSHDRHTKPFPASKVSLLLSGRASERLQFCTETTVLAQGISTFKLFCPVRRPRCRPELERLTPFKSSSWGTYVLEQTEVAVSNLRLQWNHRPTSRSPNKASRTKHTAPILIRLVKDTRAFDVRLKRPRSGK
jgi:hypothetical protein